MYYPPPTEQEDTTKKESPLHLYPSVTRGKDSLPPWYRRRENLIKLGAAGGFLLLALIIYLCVSAIAREGIDRLSLTTPSIPSRVGTPDKSAQATAKAGTAQVSIPSLHTTPTPAGSPPAMPTSDTTPTATPTSTGSQALFVQFVSIDGTIYSPSKATVQTVPGAALTINVVYCSGNNQDSSSGLKGTVHADSNGNYTWHWIPKTLCEGPAKASVTANSNGQKMTISDNFILK